MSILNDILLRIKSDPNLTAKGSALTWDEEDTNFVVIYNELVRLGTPATGGFSPYNNGTTYSNVGPDYVSYNGNIYEFINAVPTSGVTPGSDPLFWKIASLGEFSHQRNKDQYVDLGGSYEVSAQDIFNKVNETPIDVDSFFAQGGNSFTAATVLGTNDLYDLLFETNNVSRQLIDSTGRFGFGTTSLSASTHKTNKSQGNTSSGYAEKWFDSDNAEIASIDNNGLFTAVGGINAGLGLGVNVAPNTSYFGQAAVLDVVGDDASYNKIHGFFQNTVSTGRAQLLVGAGDYGDSFFAYFAHGKDYAYDFYGTGKGSGDAGWSAMVSQGAENNGLLIGTYEANPTYFMTNNTVRQFIESNGNFGFNGNDYEDGVGVMFMKSATTAPTTAPTGGIIFWNDGTSLKSMNTSGTITTY